MQLKKQDIIKMLTFREDTDVFIIFELPLTKEQRTTSQNNAFYRIFTEISKKLGYTTEETKQALMRWVFWTKEIKMWWMQFEVSIEWSTKDLTKEQSQLLISRWNEFWKKLWCGEIITSKEIQTLFDNEK